MTDPWLVLGWLLVFHLVAEYVLQGDRPAGRPGVARLVGHAVVVAVCFFPVAAAFGGPGAAVLVTAVVAHLVLDGQEVGSRREREGEAAAAATLEAEAPVLSLGPVWSVRPAASAALVQALHVLTLAVAWRFFLSTAVPSQAISDLATGIAGAGGAVDFRRAVAAALTGAAIVVVDTVAAARFVGLLLRPWGRPASADDSPSPGPALPSVAARRWRVRLGPFTGSVVADPPSSASVTAASPGATTRTPASATQVGRAIGIFERLLITMLVLAQAEAAVALVVGVKTVARYRQLDDRSFAEYYLLGTLASVSIGVAAGLLARLALR